MIAKDILTRIKEVEIQTRRLLSSSLVGDTTSALKGTGVEFDQIREYTQGDDVRFIDWHSSARTGELLVKQFMEERSRTILLVVNGSESMSFSSHENSKYDIAAQVAAVLALVAQYGKDSVGLFLNSKDGVTVMRPQRGMHHTKAIMHTLFSQKPTHCRYTLDLVLDDVMHVKKRDALLFLISDFIEDIDQKKLCALTRRYDTVAVRCLDACERQLPSIGMIHAASDQINTMGCMGLGLRSTKNINHFLNMRIEEQNRMFKAAKIDVLDVNTNDLFINEIIGFFRRRMMY